MDFFRYLANEWADITDFKFIWERIPQATSFKFDRSLPQGTICLFKMKVLSRAGVIDMEHRIMSKIIGENVWQFVLVINTVVNKFQNLVSMKIRNSEY